MSGEDFTCDDSFERGFDEGFNEGYEEANKLWILRARLYKDFEEGFIDKNLFDKIIKIYKKDCDESNQIKNISSWLFTRLFEIPSLDKLIKNERKQLI